MKKAFLIISALLLAMGVMFYTLITNQEHPSHMHFTNQGGALRNVVYYSQSPPERASTHSCDGNFAEMREDLYEIHLGLWQEKYRGGQNSGR